MSKNYAIRNKAITKEEIGEDIFLIDNYNLLDCYITKNGDVYKYYKDIDKYYKLKPYINNHNGYVYVNVRSNKGNTVSRRLHIIIAKTFIDNPNNHRIVGHKDNVKNNNSINNLYWTTTQENTQKAVDDGLSVFKLGIDNPDSKPIKVIDKDTSELVAVYGSIREAVRMVDNLNIGYVSKILKNNGNYKPRNKKYKYSYISKEEYLATPNIYKDLNLEECKSNPKNPIVFKALNLLTNEEIICDNQKKFALEHNLEQAIISNRLRGGNNGIYDNWYFEKIKEISYIESSGYKNLINLTDDVSIKNIETEEIHTFKTLKELKEYVGIKGHDLNGYIKYGNLIMDKYKIINT